MYDQSGLYECAKDGCLYTSDRRAQVLDHFNLKHYVQQPKIGIKRKNPATPVMLFGEVHLDN